MADDGEVLSPLGEAVAPSEVAKRLKLSPAQVRRYGDALEAVTGQEVRREKHARVFTRDQFEMLRKAREIVGAGFGSVSVAEALVEVANEGSVSVAAQPLEGLGGMNPDRALLSKYVEKQDTIIAMLARLDERLARLEACSQLALPAPVVVERSPDLVTGAPTPIPWWRRPFRRRG